MLHVLPSLTQLNPHKNRYIVQVATFKESILYPVVLKTPIIAKIKPIQIDDTIHVLSLVY